MRGAINRAYRTMLELKHRAVDVPSCHLRLQQAFLDKSRSGTLHNMYEQTQRNAVYLALNDRPMPLPFPLQIPFRCKELPHCTELWLVTYTYSFVNTVYRAQDKERH